MIKVIVKDKFISIKGHANYDEYGKDIVCSSVSSLIACSVNNIYKINNDSLYYSDDGKEVVIKILEDNKYVMIIYNTLIDMLIELSKEYPKNIKIESEI